MPDSPHNVHRLWSTVLRQPSTVYRSPSTGQALRAYFYSGWAFLIPYLAVYLLYYWLTWPANPVAGLPLDRGQLTHHNPPSTVSWLPIPPLLFVYWALHAIHVILAAVALGSWWRAVAPPPSTVQRPPSSVHRAALRAVAPWCFLALIFYIPGAYLEWPADPWEHLRRTNEWRILETVGAHSAWYKSSYFIPYSLLSWCVGLRQLFWLDFYHTGICLLLCWQYYRLARACGLNEPVSMIFVIVQALLFGNNIFSFYRYYGISSSIYAQLGAVALTRITLDFAAFGQTHANPIATETIGSSRTKFWHLPSLAFALSGYLALFILTAFNHVQGLGIAVVGIAAVAAWRLIDWERSLIWWLIGGTFVVNALFLWLYPRNQIIQAYQNQGWLNIWYGFNIFDLGSPAGDHLRQIVSTFGLINLVAALWLLRGNHVVIWLTGLPYLILLSPLAGVLCAKAFAVPHDTRDISVTQRLMFASPWGLAAISAMDGAIKSIRKSGFFNWSPSYLYWWKRKKTVYSSSLPVLCLSAVLVAAPRSSYSRFWNSVACTPRDLQLRDINLPNKNFATTNNVVVATLAGRAITSSFAPNSDPFPQIDFRKIGAPAGDYLKFLFPLINRLPSEMSVTARSSQKEELALEESNKPMWTCIAGNLAPLEPLNAGPRDKTSLVQNAKGSSAHVFTSILIPVGQGYQYEIRASIRGINDERDISYLAVAWYDSDDQPLKSAQQTPTGAGAPYGWINGDYSYFGLAGSPAPKQWTTYEIRFGVGTMASIPLGATALRIGGLLNFRQDPNAVVQMADVHLTRVLPAYIFLSEVNVHPYTPMSFAGLCSNHWPSTQVQVDRAGVAELQRTLKGRSLKP